MGTDDIVTEQELGQFDDSTTVGDLRAVFGDSAVKRALNYMASLSEAEEEYREATQKERYRDGMAEMAGKDADEIGEKVEEASEDWEERTNSLGINE